MSMSVLLKTALVMCLIPLTATHEFIRYPALTGSNYIICGFPITIGYVYFSIELEIRPETLDGLLVYQTNSYADFISVILDDGIVEYRFDSGSGSSAIRSLEPVNLGEWNTLEIHKHGYYNGYLKLNGADSVYGSSVGGANVLNVYDSMYLGGYKSESVISHAGTSTKLIGCVKKFTIDFTDRNFVTYSYSLLEDSSFQSKLNSSEIEVCYEYVVCDVSAVIHYVSEQMDPVCHWNKNNSPFKLESSLSSNCSLSLFNVTQQWKFFSLTAAYPAISGDNEVTINGDVTKTAVEFDYTESGEAGKLSKGVYGVSLTFGIASSVDEKNITVQGYFIVTCNDVSGSDPDCSSTISLLSDLGVSMTLSRSNHCLTDNLYSENSANTIEVDAENYNYTLYTTTEAATTEQITTDEPTTEAATTEQITTEETDEPTTEAATTEQITTEETDELTTEIGTTMLYTTDVTEIGTTMLYTTDVTEIGTTELLTTDVADIDVTEQITVISDSTIRDSSTDGETDITQRSEITITQHSGTTDSVINRKGPKSSQGKARGRGVSGSKGNAGVKGSKGVVGSSGSMWNPNATSVAVSIVCYSNCGDKVIPYKSVTLRALCKNCTDPTSGDCRDCSGSIETYTWNYLVCKDNECNTTFTSSGSNVTRYSILPLTESEIQGIVILTTTLDEGQILNASYSIQVNNAPVLRNCSVSPVSGYGLLTAFNISCDSCIDSDPPLFYSLYQISQTGIHSLIYQSETQDMESVYLMEGEATQNYTYNLSVKCTDNLGLTTNNDIQVQVFPPTAKDSNVDVLEILKNKIDEETDELLSQGSTTELLNLMQTTAVYVNKNSLTAETDAAERLQIRNASLELLTKVNISVISDFELATNTLNTITAVPGELPQQLQEEVTNLYGVMAQNLQRQVKNVSLSKAENSVGLLLVGMSSLLKFTTDDGSKKIHEVTTSNNQVNVTEDEQKVVNQVKTSTEKILSNLKVVTDTVQDLVELDTEPVSFKTEQLHIVVAKVSQEDMVPDSLTVVPDNEGSNVTAEVTFPNDKSLMKPNQENAQLDIGIQMMYMRKNPYVWDSTADDVTTAVLSLDLKDFNKNSIRVNDIQNDHFGIRLPNNDAVRFVSDHEVQIVYEYINNTITVTNSDKACRIVKFNTTKDRESILRLVPQGIDIPLIYKLMNSTDMLDLNYSQIIIEGTMLTSQSDYTFFLPLEYKDANALTVCPLVDIEYLDTYINHSKQSEECISNLDCSENFILAMNIALETYTAACIYWNSSDEVWSADGCKVSLPSSAHSIMCQCSHLTSFSGSIFIAPHSVDPFADAELFLTFFDNPIVVMTVIIIWIIYFLLLGWARKADRKDLTKTSVPIVMRMHSSLVSLDLTVDCDRSTGDAYSSMAPDPTSWFPEGGVTVLLDNSPEDKHMYLVCVVTGWRRMAGTTAHVSLSLTGSDGYCTRHCLSDSVGQRQCFTAGSEEWFLITTPCDLGHIQYLSVWHDNSGSSPEWLLSRIMIENLQTKKTWTFLYGDWIAVDRGSFSARIALESIRDEDITVHKKQNFYLKSSRDLRDGHLWISILCKPSYSTFTRAQRLSCALSLLLLTMLTSLMFHGIPLDDPADQASMGAISFSLADIVIGIQSGLIMFPISIIILQLFLRAGRKPRKVKSKYSNYRQTDASDLSLDMEMDSNDATDHKTEDTDQELVPKTDVKMLPWWTVYIAWTLVITTSVISSYFVMLYGLKYGYQKSLEWLLSFFTAFFQSAFITQPLKVIGVAMLMTVILKKPVQLEGGKADTFTDKTPDTEETSRQHYIPDPLTKREINKIRKRLELEWLTVEKLRDIGLYLIYICIVLFMVHGQRPIALSYQCTNTLENIFINPTHEDDHLALESITTPMLFWEYVDAKILPVLNEMSIFNESTLITTSSFYLVGLYRFRQLRVKSDSCKFQSDLIKMLAVPQTCKGSYWLGDEDTSHYNYSWLKPWSDSALNNEWSYQSSWQLKTIPYGGIHATYGGGGYVVELQDNQTATAVKLSTLKKSSWIDDRTRAVFIEFTVFNPNVNLFSVVMLLFEFPNTGGIFSFHQIFTTKLFHYTNGLEIFAAVCEGSFLLFTLVFSYIEMQKIRKHSLKVYLSDTWNIVEFLQICLSYSIIGIFFQRLVSVDSVMAEYNQKRSKSFVSFYSAVSWDFILQYLMAALVAIVILKTFKLLKFNKKMFFLSSTLAHGSKGLFNFAIMAVILISAFAHFSTLVFGPFINGLKSFGGSLLTLFNFAIGVSYYYELYEANFFFGPILYFSFFLVVNCFLLVMFMAIINFAIQDSQETISNMKNELEVMDYIMDSLFSFFPKSSKEYEV